MERSNALRLTEELRAELTGNRVDRGAPFVVPADRYRDAGRFEAERALFDFPRIVAASSELEVGACVPIDVPGRSIVLTRAADGLVRGFENSCRHRGTRLVGEACHAKAMVCPYHAWTYDLRGSLVHVPHLDSFAGLDPSRRGLREVEVAERHGLVWLGDAARYLGAIDADVGAIGFDRHAVSHRSRTTRACNWKLVIEAFLDGYHIRILHRDSLARFFLDACSIAEPVGPHIRTVSGRRAMLEAPSELAGLDLRTLGTATLFLFPSTVVIEHPDFVSILTVHPLAHDLTHWEHTMLVPADRIGETEHWHKSWKLIEEGVFQSEDLWVCEEAQRGIANRATDELLFGSLEYAARWFHAQIDARC